MLRCGERSSIVYEMLLIAIAHAPELRSGGGGECEEGTLGPEFRRPSGDRTFDSVADGVAELRS